MTFQRGKSSIEVQLQRNVQNNFKIFKSFIEPFWQNLINFPPLQCLYWTRGFIAFCTKLTFKLIKDIENLPQTILKHTLLLDKNDIFDILC